MSKNDSAGENNPLQAERPFTSFFQLDSKSSVPSEFQKSTDIIYDNPAPVVGWIARPHHKTIRCTRSSGLRLPFRLYPGQVIGSGQKIRSSLRLPSIRFAPT